MSGDVKIANIRLDDIRVHAHNVRRDLGDLRTLVESIVRYGVMQPIVVEHRGDHFRIRAGHRRFAAARIAGLTRIPAVIHGEALDNCDWLVHAVQENVIRKGLSKEERRDVVGAMRCEGMRWTGIAEAFGVRPETVRSWMRDDPTTPHDEAIEGIAEKVAELTRQGRSAAQIADELAISQRHVVRYRTGKQAGDGRRRYLAGRTLQSFTAAWREYAAAHPVTVEQILDALDVVAAEAAIGNALPEKREDAA